MTNEIFSNKKIILTAGKIVLHINGIVIELILPVSPITVGRSGGARSRRTMASILMGERSGGGDLFLSLHHQSPVYIEQIITK